MRDLNNIPSDAIALYIKGLEAKGYSKQEIAAKLRNIGRFTQWAYDKDHLQYSRYQHLKDQIAKYSLRYESSADFPVSEDQSRAVSLDWASPIKSRAPPADSDSAQQNGHIVDVSSVDTNYAYPQPLTYRLVNAAKNFFANIPVIRSLPFLSSIHAQMPLSADDRPVLGPVSEWPRQEDTEPEEDSAGFNFRHPAFLVGTAMTLLIFGVLTAGIYDRFFKEAESTLAYPATPTSPTTRFLSFQGRLTDSLGNPITTSTNMQFRLYDASTAGSTLYDSGTCAISPDQDGVHNVLIGQDCGSAIGSDVFTENAEIWLGVKVGTDAEMTPRQQIANVPYALNAETLQGLPLGTAASSVPYINQAGDLLIGAASPQIGSTYASQTFLLSSANAITIQSAGTGDITLSATGSGDIILQANGDTDDYVYLTTTTNDAQVLFEGYTANDPGVRLNSATNQLEYRDENESGWTTFDANGTNYWQLNTNVLAPGGDATVTDALVLGGNTSTVHQFDVSGAKVGKALVLFDETGNQNILTASSSGTTRLNLTNAGQLELKADGSTAGITIGAGDDIALYHDGTDSILTTSTGDWNITATDDFIFTDAQVTNIQLSDVDTSLPNSNTGIVDAINDAWNAATGSGGVWTDSGTTVYVTDTTDEVVIGGSSPLSSAKLSIDGDADQVQFIVQGNGTQTNSLAIFENSAGTDQFTISNTGDIVATGDLAVNGGDVTSSAATVNLFNATPTTLNIGGAATTVELGAATGTTSINNALTVDGNTTLGNASGDTVTANADAWTFANDTAVTLSGGVNGLNFDSNTLSIDAANDRIGIGTAAPDAAWVDIAAATTSKAQLNLTSSAATDVSTPGSGDLWWNGTNLYFYNGSSNVDLLNSGSGGAWSDLTDPAADLTLAMTDYATTFNWDTAINDSYFALNIDNNGGTAGNDYLFSLVNAVSTQTTGDLNTEALLLLDQADTTASGTTAVDNAILITNSGGSTLTDGIQIGTGSQAITNAINIGSTGVTTDIVLQNGETIDNDTDGTITMTGAVAITGTSNLQGNVANSTGNLVLADTVDIGSASTGINITTAGVITDSDGNVVIDDTVDLGSATTGINITTAGAISDSDGNVAINDTVDVTGNITATGDLAVNGDDITSDGNLTLNATGYVRVGDTATPGSANGDDDLFVEGDIEVDGVLYLDGTLDTTFTAGSIVFAGTSGVLSEDNSNFFWDNSAKELGIGTNTPAAALDVLDTTEQLRLSYDGSNYASFTVGASGDLTLAPSGSDLNLTGNQDISGTLAVGNNATYSAERIIQSVHNFTAAQNSYGIFVSPTFNFSSTGQEVYGIYNYSLANTLNDGYLYAARNTAATSSTTALDEAIGTYSQASISSSGSITSVYGARNEVTISSASVTSAYGTHNLIEKISGTLTSGYGSYNDCRDATTCYGVASITTDATPTTSYGLYVNTSGAGTNNYGIYGVAGDWVLAADGDGTAGGTGSGGDLVLGAGQDFELYHDGTDSRIITNTGDLNLFATDDFVFDDLQLTSAITLTDVDTDFDSGDTAIVDAINAAYQAALGGGGGLWTDSGTTTYLTTTTDDVVLGGSSPIAGGKFSIDGDADQIQLVVQGNATQTSGLALFEQFDGTDVFTIANSGDLVTAGDLAVNGGDVTSSASTVNLFNATPTTLNIGGAATTVELGAATGTTSVNNALTIDGNTTLGNASGDSVTSNAATWTFANDTAVTLSGGVDGLNFDSNTLSIDAAGNKIGIGTAAPVGKLHTTGAVTGKALAIFNETGDQDILTASASGTTRFRVSNTGDVVGGRFVDISNSDFFVDPAATGSTAISIAGSGIFDAAASGKNYVFGDGTAAALVDVGGGVANFIDGTNDLIVADDVEIDGDLYVAGGIDTAFTEGSVVFAGASGLLTEDNSNFFWDNTGNELGIGTTGPDATLDVLDTTGPQLRLTYTDGSVYTDFTTNSGGDLTIAPSGGDTSLTGTLAVTSTSDFQDSIADSTGDLTINDNLIVTGTSDLRGDISDSLGNLVLADTVDIGSATTGINITTAGVITDSDGNVVIDDTVDLGSATTGINITAAGLITDSDGNVVIGDTVDLGSASTGINITTAGTISDSDGNVAINDTVDVTGDITSTGDLAVNGGDLTSSAATFNLLNATPTTINFGGAATTVEIGATTGTTSVNNALTVDGNTTLGNASGDSVTSNAATWTFANATNFDLASSATALTFETDLLGLDTSNDGVDITSAATTTDILDITANSLTTGTALDIDFNALTSGTGLSLASTSTGLTSGSLATIDWSPGSSTTATGDLFSINIGTNGNVDTLFNVTDTGTSLFKVTESGIESSVPASFTSAGDVSFAYDAIFTNQSGSQIESYGPFSIIAGEAAESNDLTLTTYNSGDIVLDAGGSTSNTGTISFYDSNIKGATVTTPIPFADSSADINTFRSNFTGENIIDAINETYAAIGGGGTNYFQLNSNVLAPGNDATVTDALVLGGNTTTNFQFEVSGAKTGKALAVFNETGNQDILVASASGATRLRVSNAGHVLPGADDSYDLGSSTFRFRDLYLGPQSLHIGTSGNEGIIGYDTSNNWIEFNPSGDGTEEATLSDAGTLVLVGDLTVNGDDISNDSNLTISATGYVRIGDTATPGAATGDDDLFVEGDIELDGTLYADGAVIIDGNTTLGDAASDTVTFTADVASHILPSADDTYDLGASGARWRDIYVGPKSLHIGVSGNEATIGYDTTANAIEFDPDGDATDEFTISDAGAVAFDGTLTINSSYSFSSAGAITAATSGTINGLDISSGAISGTTDFTVDNLNINGNTILANTGNINFQPDNDTDDYLYMDTTTNVPGLFWEGIAATDPGIYVNGTELGYRDETDGWVSFDSLAGGGGGAFTDSTTTAYLTDTTDEVVIGATSPVSSAKLSIDGDAAAQIQFLIQGATSQSADYFVVENSAGTDQFTIDSSGNVTLVGDLAVNGDDITADGDLTINAAGDDLKTEDRVTIGSATAGVHQLAVTGFETGKALAVFNETGDQNILVASDSGSGVFAIGQAGDISNLGSTAINAFGDQGSIVPNASFEVDNTGNSFPDGWSNVVGTATYTTTGGGHGEAYLTISSNGSYGIQSGCFPISPNQSYNISIRARNNVGTAAITRLWLYEATTRANCVSGTFAANNFTATLNVNANWSATGAALGAATGSTSRWGAVRIYNYSGLYNMDVDGVRLTPASTTTGLDLAETYPVNPADKIEPGHIVAFGVGQLEQDVPAIRKSSEKYDQDIFGVVATQPGLVLDDNGNYPKARIALSGRVPVQVTSENGPIRVGDAITASSIPGVGMRSTKPGRVIGRAMNEWDHKDPKELGSVTVFVEPAYDSGYILTETKKLIKDAQKAIVADSIKVKNLVAQSFSAVTATIDTLVVDRLVGREAVITDAEIDQLNAQAARIENLEAEQAKIKNLESESIESDTIDATTIVADNIDSQNVRELRDRLERLSQEQSDVVINSEELDNEIADIQAYITELSGQETSEDVADPETYQLLEEDISLDPGTTESLLGENFTSVNLEKLTVTGTASMTSLTVADAFSAGEVFIKDNVILSLNNELKLGALESVNIMNGGVIITADGTITAKGAIIAEKGIRTNSIESLSSGDDVSVKLDSSEFAIEDIDGVRVAQINEKGSAAFNDLSLSTYTDATSSAVVIAARDNYRESGLYAPAIKTNAAASGNGILPSGENDIIIFNNSIKKNSVITVTATSSTQNNSMYVDRVEACNDESIDDPLSILGTSEKDDEKTCTPYFRVALDNDINKDVTFNWLIVN